MIRQAKYTQSPRDRTLGTEKVLPEVGDSARLFGELRSFDDGRAVIECEIMLPLPVGAIDVLQTSCLVGRQDTRVTKRVELADVIAELDEEAEESEAIEEAQFVEESAKEK